MNPIKSASSRSARIEVAVCLGAAFALCAAVMGFLARCLFEVGGMDLAVLGCLTTLACFVILLGVLSKVMQ
jgi:hypothetical protein